MRTAAEVEPFTLRIDPDLVAFGNGVDQLELEGFAFALEQGLRRLAIHDLAGEGRIARDDLGHLGLDLRQIVRREVFVARKIVIEAVLDHRADGHLRAGIKLLHGLRHDMRRVVPDQRERFWILSREDADLGIRLDRLGKVLDLAVECHRHRLLGERLGNRLGDLAARDARLEFAARAVWKLQGNHLSLLSLLRTSAGKRLGMSQPGAI